MMVLLYIILCMYFVCFLFPFSLSLSLSLSRLPLSPMNSFSYIFVCFEIQILSAFILCFYSYLINCTCAIPPSLSRRYTSFFDERELSSSYNHDVFQRRLMSQGMIYLYKYTSLFLPTLHTDCSIYYGQAEPYSRGGWVVIVHF